MQYVEHSLMHHCSPVVLLLGPGLYIMLKFLPIMLLSSAQKVTHNVPIFFKYANNFNK